MMKLKALFQMMKIKESPQTKMTINNGTSQWMMFVLAVKIPVMLRTKVDGN